MSEKPLYVLAGPTAVGKGTVLHAVREAHPDLQVSVSATTREPRPGEQDGRDYFFVSDREFDDLVRRNALLEWATVHGANRYGTPAPWVQQMRDLGRTVLLEVDLDGARQVKKNMPDAHLIFVAPPSWSDLEKRLESRGTEGPEERVRRLQTAREEMAAIDEFDTVIVNDDVERAAAELAGVLGLD